MFRRCIFIGGGPIDGFLAIQNDAQEWRCYAHNLGRSRGMELAEDPAEFIPVETHTYRRTAPRVFVHESEL